MANTNIAMGYQGLQLQNPLDSYAKVMGIQQAQNQNALAQYQLSSAQRNDQNANRLQELTRGFTPDMRVEDQVNQLTRGGFLKEGQSLAETHMKMTKDKAEADKSAEDVAAKRVEKWSKFLPVVNDPDSYASWRDGMTRDLPGLAAVVPRDYSPEAVKQLAAQANNQNYDSEYEHERFPFSDLRIS